MAPNPNETGEKCPFNTEHYPPVAPIPASRLSRKSSKTRMTSGASSGLAVPPNLPSRCTWKPNAKNSPHSVDPRCVLKKGGKSKENLYFIREIAISQFTLHFPGKFSICNKSPEKFDVKS